MSEPIVIQGTKWMGISAGVVSYKYYVNDFEPEFNVKSRALRMRESLPLAEFEENQFTDLILALADYIIEKYGELESRHIGRDFNMWPDSWRPSILPYESLYFYFYTDLEETQAIGFFPFLFNRGTALMVGQWASSLESGFAHSLLEFFPDVNSLFYSRQILWNTLDSVLSEYELFNSAAGKEALAEYNKLLFDQELAISAAEQDALYYKKEAVNETASQLQSALSTAEFSIATSVQAKQNAFLTLATMEVDTG